MAHDTPVSAFELELRAPDGSIVPTTMVPDTESSEYLIKPSQPLDVGTYKFRYRRLCTYLNPTGYDETLVFIGAATPLPSVVGTAQVRSQVAEMAGSTTCLPLKVDAVVDVTMSPEFAAYQELARYRVTFRLQPLQLPSYLPRDPPGEVDYGNIPYSTAVLSFPIRDTCELGQERIQGRLEIAAHIAGATSDPPPLVVDVDVACPSLKNGTLPLCTDLDSGTVVVADAATPADGSLPNTSSDEAGCKCALSRGHGPAGSALASLLGLGLLILGRRRRG
jgi:MYXO-CTERM domain-containing protein